MGLNTRIKKYNKGVKKSSNYAKNKPRVQGTTALDIDVAFGFSAVKTLRNILSLCNKRKLF